MRLKSKNSISIKFVIFIVAICLVILFYLSTPDNMKEVKKSKTFEEMLEYSHKPTMSKTNLNEEEEYDEEDNIKQTIKKYSSPQFEEVEPPASKAVVAQPKPAYSIDEYNKLLDRLTEYPAKNLSSAKAIVNKILLYKGYPENTVSVIASDIDQSKAKTQGNYLAANFDFESGNMYISNKVLYSIDNKTLIAILVHELDHFDKLAKTCKAIGINEFKTLTKESKININEGFWKYASQYANTNNFDTEQYKTALKRFITQNELELSSSYSDFYRLSENMRNPLEISAYKESDYVYNHYKIKIADGPMKQLTKKFNSVDWAIYNKIITNPALKDERIALFDYFYMLAILKTSPEFKSQYDYCIKQKNGDMTSFWLAFENSVKSFYLSGKMDNATYEKIYNILNVTENLVKTNTTPTEIATALKLKMNTLKSNLVYPNAVKNLQNTAQDYLKYTKSGNISDPKQELEAILTLICIENDFTTKNKDKSIGLYYVKMPEFLTQTYNIRNTKQKFLFIYNNPEFKAETTANNEQNHLVDLINQHRLDIRIKG